MKMPEYIPSIQVLSALLHRGFAFTKELFTTEFQNAYYIQASICLNSIPIKLTYTEMW